MKAKACDLKSTCRVRQNFSHTWALLLALLFLASCTTIPEIPGSTSSDLSSSYAVRSFEKKRQFSEKLDTRDPRSYYHYLVALKAEKSYRMEQAALHYQEVVLHDPEAEKFHEKCVRLLLRTGQLDKPFEQAKMRCRVSLKMKKF